MAAAKNSTQLPRSDAGIDKLKVPDLKPSEYGDGSGLRLRISPAGKSGRGGAKVWRWFVVLDGRRVNVTLGDWSRDGSAGLTLSKARQRLDELRAANQAGHLRDELARLGSRRATAPASGNASSGPTVKEVVEAFRAFVGRRRKRPAEVEWTLDKVVLPALGERPIGSITTKEVRELVEVEVRRGAPTQAGKVLAHIKQLFRFAQGRDDVQANPADPLQPDVLGVVNRTCDRYLSPEEIAPFWHALDKSSATPTVRLALRLLLLLGVRSGELLRATWEEVDLEAATWTVPVAHQKLTRQQETRARPWVVPLAPKAAELMRELQAFAKSIGSKYVAASFAAEDGAGLSEQSLSHAMRRLFQGEEPLLKFAGERPTPHDLRRTVRTHLGDTLGVDFHIAERCLNHSLGRVAATYDRGDYVQQRREALEKWAAYVERLVSGKKKVAFPNKVAGLPSAPRAS